MTKERRKTLTSQAKGDTLKPPITSCARFKNVAFIPFASDRPFVPSSLSIQCTISTRHSRLTWDPRNPGRVRDENYWRYPASFFILVPPREWRASSPHRSTSLPVPRQASTSHRPKRLLDRFAQRSHRPGTAIVVVLSGAIGRVVAPCGNQAANGQPRRNPDGIHPASDQAIHDRGAQRQSSAPSFRVSSRALFVIKDPPDRATKYGEGKRGRFARARQRTNAPRRRHCRSAAIDPPGRGDPPVPPPEMAAMVVVRRWMPTLPRRSLRQRRRAVVDGRTVRWRCPGAAIPLPPRRRAPSTAPRRRRLSGGRRSDGAVAPRRGEEEWRLCVAPVVVILPAVAYGRRREGSRSR